jgi:ubiquinone/menaquinone biosynthesis C-methylase UbiE
LDNSNPTLTFDPTQYKINNKTNWDAIAQLYHKDWASTCTGPFKSTIELVRLADINSSDTVLDLACGTGAVSKEAVKIMGNNEGPKDSGRKGMLVGVDISRSALSIAKASISPYFAKPLFIEMDAENLAFRKPFFTKILCQFGLTFFPNTPHVLKELKELLVKDGKLFVAVHGIAENVPYFSCIMDSILKYIPDARPKGSPTVHTFGDPVDLYKMLEDSGYSNISVKKHTFYYQAGTFEQYWFDYMSSTANSIRPLIESKGTDIIFSIKKDSKETAAKHSDGKGIINFPWEVLIATANKDGK